MNSGSFSYHSLEASQTIQKTKYCSFIPFLLFLRPLALVDYEKSAQKLFCKIHTFMLSWYTVPSQTELRLLPPCDFRP